MWHSCLVGSRNCITPHSPTLSRAWLHCRLHCSTNDAAVACSGSARRRSSARRRRASSPSSFRATDLPLVGPTCDTVAEFKLNDPDAPDGPDVRRTAPVFNERSPRYRAKQDFVYVSATSTLTITIYDQPGLLEFSNLLKLGRKSDTPLGKVRIHVKDVAKIGHLKDSFPLQARFPSNIARPRRHC